MDLLKLAGTLVIRHVDPRGFSEPHMFDTDGAFSSPWAVATAGTPGGTFGDYRRLTPRQYVARHPLGPQGAVGGRLGAARGDPVAFLSPGMSAYGGKAVVFGKARIGP